MFVKERAFFALLLLLWLPLLQGQEVRRPTVETVNFDELLPTKCGNATAAGSAGTPAMPLFFDVGGQTTSSTLTNIQPVFHMSALYSSFPSASGSYSALNLIVTSQVTAFDAITGTFPTYRPSVTFCYSLNLGVTWNVIRASSNDVSPVITTIPLPFGQDLTKIWVFYDVPSSELDPNNEAHWAQLTGYDIRTEGTLGSPPASAPSFSPPDQTVSTSFLSVTLSSTTSASTICYTTDGTAPTTNGAGTCTHGSTYSSPVSVTQTEQIQAVTTKSGFADSPIAESSYTIGVPTFTPPAGTYSNSQNVAVSCPTGTPAGADVYYTTDGTTPTRSSRFGSNGLIVQIDNSETLQAFCTAAGYGDTPIGSAVYNLTLFIVTTTCPDGQVGNPYTCTLVANQGKLPFSWSISSGILPQGTTILSNQSPAGNGAITGLPSLPGINTFTVRLSDGAGNFATQALSIRIANPYATVSTRLSSVSASANPTNSYMQMSLANCGSNVPNVPGSSVVVQPVTTFRPNASGLISGRVLGNDIINCGGTTNSVYTVQFYVNNAPSGPPLQYNVLSNNVFDPTTATAVVPGPAPPVSPFGYVFAAPPGNQTVAQKPNTSLTITGQTNLDTLGLKTYAYSTLPTNLPAGSYANQSDGDTSNPCGIGGGSTLLLCQWNGTLWTAVQGSGGGGGGGNTTSTSLVNGKLPVATGPTALGNSGVAPADLAKVGGSNTYTGATNDFTSTEVKVPSPVNPADAANLSTVQAVGQVNNCSSLNSFALYFATGKVVNCEPNLSETLGTTPVLSFLGQISGFSIATVGSGAGELSFQCGTALATLGAGYAGVAAPPNCVNGLRLFLPSDKGTDGQAVVQLSHSGQDVQLGYGNPSAAAGGSPGQIQENIGGSLAGASYLNASDAQSSLTIGDTSHGILNVFQINSNQSSVSNAGFLNLARGDTNCWRNWGNTGSVDDCIGINSSDRFIYTTPAGTFVFASLADITFGNITGRATQSQVPTDTVYNDQANTFTTGLQDFGAAQLKLPAGAALTETTSGRIGYDTTSNNLHAGISGSDSIIPTVIPGTAVNGQCPTWIVSGGTLTFGSAACSGGGGGGNMNFITGVAALGDVPQASSTNGQSWSDPQILQLKIGPPNAWQQGPAHFGDDLLIQSAPGQTSTGSTKESSLALKATDVGSSSSGGSNVGGDIAVSGGDCALTLSSANSCQGGNVYIGAGGLTGALTASVNNPIPGNTGIFTSWRKGNSGNLTTGNSGRLLCGDGTDTQSNVEHNTADICGGVGGDYVAPVGFFVFSNAGRFVNPNGEKLAVQVAGSASGVQSNGSEQWAVNAPVCSDPSHAGYVTSPSSGHCFCPAKRVGTNRIAEGSAVTSHSIDIHLGDACEQQIQVAGTNITTQSPENFQSGNGIAVSNPSAGNVSVAIASPTVANNQANTYTGGFLQDMSNVTVKLPVQAGGVFGSSNGAIEYDSSGKNWHMAGNSVDNVAVVTPAASLPTNGHCPQWSVVSGVVTLGDSGGTCSGGGGSGTVSSGSAGQVNWYAAGGTTTSGNAGFNLNSSGTLTKIGGVSTAGNFGTPVIVYNTVVTSRNSTLSSTTMVASAASAARYRFSFDAKAVDGGTGCTGTGTVQVMLSYTDSDTSVSVSSVVGVQAAGSTIIGSTTSLPTTIGGVTQSNIAHSIPFTFTVANTSAVSFVANYTAGSGCSTGQRYMIYPTLEELN